MTEVIQLGAHSKMTVEECLDYCCLEKDKYQSVMVLSFDEDGDLLVRSSHMSRKDALWMLMEAVDHARGKTSGD